MNIGFLDRRISFYAPSNSINSYGEKTGNDTLYATVWAAMDHKSASSKMDQEQESSINNLVWRVRSSTTTRAITPKYTIRYGSDSYEILAIQEVGRNSELHFVSRRIVSE
jgi:SPP1 family predicted phage head-tail adaptor